MSFSENFKAARKNSGLSQQQLADMLGMNRSSISKYENDIGFPLAKTLQRICEIFGVTIDSMLKYFYCSTSNAFKPPLAARGGCF